MRKTSPSSTPFIITRAEVDAGELLESLDRRKFRPVLFPLTEISRLPCDWASFFARDQYSYHLIATSAHGIDAFPFALYKDRIASINLVGKRTQRQIPQNIFACVRVNCFANVDALIENIQFESRRCPAFKKKEKYLYLRGEMVRKNLKKALHAFCEIEEIISYKAASCSLQLENLQKALRESESAQVIVGFFSMQAVQIWEKFIKKNQEILAGKQWIVICFSKVISDALSSDFLWYDKKYCSDSSLVSFCKILNNLSF